MRVATVMTATSKAPPCGRPECDSGAIDLNGKSCINCTDPAKLQITGPMTIACWIKPAGLAGQQALVARDASYVFKVNVNTLRFTTPGVRDHSAVNTPLEAKTWQHVAVTFQPGQARGVAFYLNGAQTSQLDASTLPGGTGPFRIGTDQWNEWFTGQIDDVRVYTHVLTELEVRALMMNQTYPFAVLTAPADGSAIASGQVVLEWRKGPLAVSHNVYFSEDAQAVADGAAGADRHNQRQSPPDRNPGQSLPGGPGGGPDLLLAGGRSQ